MCSGLGAVVSGGKVMAEQRDTCSREAGGTSHGAVCHWEEATGTPASRKGEPCWLFLWSHRFFLFRQSEIAFFVLFHQGHGMTPIWLFLTFRED